MPLHEWLYPLAVILLGYVVLGITGFGSSLVMVPLLVRQWPLAETVALAILLDIPASLLHGGLNLRQVRWPELSRLLPGMALGSALGLWLLGGLDKRWLMLALGAYVVMVAVRGLRPRPQFQAAHAHWAHLAGTLVGLIEVLFATAGPLVVAWLQRRTDDVQALRATVPVVMALAGSVALAVLLSSGVMASAALWPRWLLGLPLSIAGVVLGNRLATRIPPTVMKRLMAALLCVSGLSLMRQFWV